ncbi:kinase-like protein [Armillaria gallica]|uniref:Kinase-like protein n=1 Tax=Armillaria gallica TaxID=47427 RepID=A0A2H3CLD5_ARMGA|nr:kinase-like protein [Armillaria gallica]
MATTTPTGLLRKKRNFKALQLPATSAETAPNGLLLAPTPQRTGMRSALSTTLADLNANSNTSENKPNKRFGNLQNDDFRNLEELGTGNGGSVIKVEHLPTGVIMAKKIVLIDAKPSVRKQILRELHIMHDCDSPYIVSSYGAYLTEPNICICMEFMDKRSFDGVYKRNGPIDIRVVGKVAFCVLEGLRYLYDVHRIIHRDIKPSNILLNSAGEIKLCDFGVSGELINSIANTFVGTSIYMSPERIQGGDYSVKSDIWSLGITLIELAHGRFPFNDSDSDDEDDMMEDSLRPPTITPDSPFSRRRSRGVSLHGSLMTMSIIELMHQIVKEPAPRLMAIGPDGVRRFPIEAEEFVDACLDKEPEKRGMPGGLAQFKWIEMSKNDPIDLKAWAATT